MRRPRPRLLISALGLTAVLAASGCGVAADDTAATVGSETISASTVNSLASSQVFLSAMASQAREEQRHGVVDGESARQVLGFLISEAVLAQENARWDAPASAADRSSAETRIKENAPDLTAAQKQIVARYLANGTALQRRFADIDASDDADLRKLYDGLPDYWDRACLTAVVVPGAEADRAQAAIDGGTALADLADKISDAQVSDATKGGCLPVSTLPVTLRDAVTHARSGRVVGPVTGAFASEDAVVWFRVTSTRHLSFDDARQDLQQLAAAAVKSGIDQWLTLRANELVTIDPRYGSSVAVTQNGLSVTAPAVPIGTKPLAASADAVSGATP